LDVPVRIIRSLGPAASNAGTYAVLRELRSQSDLIYDAREQEKLTPIPIFLDPKLAREIAIAWSSTLARST
jgi:hypothetical protein